MWFSKTQTQTAAAQKHSLLPSYNIASYIFERVRISDGFSIEVAFCVSFSKAKAIEKKL
jgi:hypothetical protein